MDTSTSLNQFLDELNDWTLRLEEKWTNASSLQYDSDPSEQAVFENQLNVLKGDLAYYTENNDQLTVNHARDLKQTASKLADQWRNFLNGHPSRGFSQNPAIGIGQHKLPPLPYAYNALEPYIDERIMRLHHDKHHRSYVEGLNKAEKEMQKARQNNNFDLIKHWEREAAFNGAGHYLHTIFWNVMHPDGGGKPKGELSNAINQSFGSFDQFKNHFSEAAKKVEAVGWAILVYSPRSHRLEILQAEKHQNLSQWDVIPLLVLDVWEHAYYLQYENNRGKYVDNWWNVVNWNEVEKRYREAQKVKWKAY
ncbi:superoxide dismutase [Tenuibacillus multivorans]|uniref:superoxide dismutase n=1 Tax=Tenuibacillus multivorans TaxID=237069 RepID=A0A1H0CNR3_9BACI|nr:superoxide dismutase [Tenuibacillus multivorans]GEL76226.1 hypothetical protein TMU01_04610 [Tenuibacillus multivorans]SDN59502.1 superoxide dismutase, Fe-Mn family [Tenuibacillus multivorans]